MATATRVRVSNWTLALAAEEHESRVALNLAGPSNDMLGDVNAWSHVTGAADARVVPRSSLNRRRAVPPASPA